MFHFSHPHHSLCVLQNENKYFLLWSQFKSIVYSLVGQQDHTQQPQSTLKQSSLRIPIPHNTNSLRFQDNSSLNSARREGWKHLKTSLPVMSAWIRTYLWRWQEVEWTERENELLIFYAGPRQLHKSSDESSQQLLNCRTITFYCPSSSHQLPLPHFQSWSPTLSVPAYTLWLFCWMWWLELNVVGGWGWGFGGWGAWSGELHPLTT